MFVADDASPPVKTAQNPLPTDLTSLRLHLQLPQQQQQLVTSSLQQRQQQQSPKCGPHKRFQQQPVSPQRSHQQPQEEHQTARAPSYTESPASAVDRSARSSTRGGCTEEMVKQDVQPEHVPAQHPTRSIASINARAVDETVGCADVTMRPSDGHLHRSSHVSAAHDVTAVQRSTLNNPVRIKAPGSSTAGRNRPRPVPSSLQPIKIEEGEKVRTGSTDLHHKSVWSTKTSSSSFISFARRSTPWCRLNIQNRDVVDLWPSLQRIDDVIRLATHGGRSCH